MTAVLVNVVWSRAGSARRFKSGWACVSYSRLPAAPEIHRARRRIRFKPRRLGPGNLREPRIFRFPGEALSGQSEAQRVVGPAGLSELRGDPGARRSRADHHPDGRRRRHARRGRGERPEMRADLCRAIRRRRRRRGPKARAGVAGAVRQARASHFRPELHGLARAPREAAALSGQARARTEAGLGRRRVPVRRHVPVLAAAGGAARPRFFLCGIERQRARSRSRRLHQFPGRRRAHQDHRLPGRRRSPAAGVHGGGGKGARRPASRSCWSRSGAASAARRRR